MLYILQDTHCQLPTDSFLICIFYLAEKIETNK